ncbi:MAG: SMC-Scp complex subunit ScpB [Planctomycetota bacterium]|jgi:segregation and condensation protein B
MPEIDTTSVEDPSAASVAPADPAPTSEQPERSAADVPCGDRPLTERVEALLVSTDRALSEARIAALLGIETKGAARAVSEAIEALNAGYDEAGRAFRAERLAGGWQLLTRPEFGPLLARMHSERQQSRLSQAALETLAIIAYRQPIMRAEIEAIRGVACGEVLRGLLERRLVKITGRAEELGRPMLYGTTKEFLNVFGLSGPDDLPEVEGLDRRPSARSAPAPPSSAEATGPEAEARPEPTDQTSPAAEAPSTDEDRSEERNEP